MGNQKTIDIELTEAIEKFVDAKLAEVWAINQKPFNHGIVEEAVRLVAEKRDLMYNKILQLTWAASSK